MTTNLRRFWLTQGGTFALQFGTEVTPLPACDCEERAWEAYWEAVDQYGQSGLMAPDEADPHFPSCHMDRLMGRSVALWPLSRAGRVFTHPAMTR